MWQAIRLTLRALFRNRTFAAVSCITLAIGIGATATTFMLVHAVLIESMPYHDPASLVTIGGRMQRDGTVQQYPISYLDVQALSTSDAFESIAGASSTRSFNLTANGEVEHLTGEMVGPAYASVLGIRLAQGRWFTDAENQPPDADRVVVLSHALWQRRFGSTPVLGTTLHLNETSYTVIGVAEEGFTGLSDHAELWLPLGNSRAVYGAHYTDMRQFRWLFAVARLRPGVTPEQAQARIDALSTNLQREFVVDNANLSFGLTPIVDAYLGDLRTPLLALFGAGVFVLLIAGTNVANLQLVRALSRRRELALRSALGATGGRLAGYAIVESIGLVLVSAALGLLVAQGIVRVLEGTGSLSFASYVTPRLHPLVVIVSVGIALGCVLLTALMPALYAARTAPGIALGDGGKGSTIGRGHLRLQRGLVVFEVALALTLLTGAGLMVKGFSRFVGTDLGYKAAQVLSARIDLTADRFKANENIWQVVRTLTTELGTIPGVNSVAAEGPGFPGSGWYQITLLRDGIDTEENRIPARRHHVTPGYLETMGVQLRAGRDLDANDVAGAPMAIVVSERFAKRAWPDESPIGQRMLAQGGTTELTVVGVAADVQHSGLQTGDTPPVDVYISLFQSPPRSPSLVTFFLATQRAPNAIIPSLAPVLQRIDRDLAFYDVRSMTQRLRDQTSTGRLLMAIMLSFAFVGLGLAGLGVYGIIAYIAQLRTKEVGIRVALGAEHGMVLREMMRQSVTPVVAGVLLGGVGVVACTRFLESLLYGVSPLDPSIVVSTAIALLIVAAGASWLPARRATRVDPVRSLRAD